MRATDLPARLHAVLKRTGTPLSVADISVKFDVPRQGLEALLAEYVNRAYLDRKHTGKGNYEYSVGPIDPDVVPPRAVEADPFAGLEAVGYDEVPPDHARRSKYDSLFAKLTKPGLCIEGLPREIHKRLRTNIQDRHKRGQARYTVRTVDGKVNLYRLPDAQSAVVQPIKRAA